MELLRRVLGRAAAPAEALDPRRLNRGMSYKYTLKSEKCRSEAKRIKSLQMTLKRDIIVVRTNRFWYDNENSYTSQMVRTIKYFAENC